MRCEKDIAIAFEGGELISAKQANTRTKKNIIDTATVELKKIADKINDSINDGCFYTTIYELSEEAREKLEALGYRIGDPFPYDDSFYTISWD